MVDPDRISAEPTKAFFVQMLTRDIDLEQAVLDLVDNSVDGAKKSCPNGDFTGKQVYLTVTAEFFEIRDNCGGFSRRDAQAYAFRFGRAEGYEATAHSIGQFGVGMKRALFKFGSVFSVTSAIGDDKWSVRIDVPEWLTNTDWHFDWAEAPEYADVQSADPGTVIRVEKLYDSVSSKFGLRSFQGKLTDLIKEKHRQFIAQGLDIFVNGVRLNAKDLLLSFKSGQFSPAIETFSVDFKQSKVVVKIIVGVGRSAPSEAGWYIICNGRIVLAADRRERTGWGVAEEASKRVIIPAYHNQFSRFRGIVAFDSDDSSLVPWNTTKDDIDTENRAWIAALRRMKEMARPVIDFLNELDRELDTIPRRESALYKFVEGVDAVPVEKLPERASLKLPDIQKFREKVVVVKIQYDKPIKEVEYLKKKLGVGSAVAVGKKTFEIVLRDLSE